MQLYMSAMALVWPSSTVPAGSATPLGEGTTEEDGLAAGGEEYAWDVEVVLVVETSLDVVEVLVLELDGGGGVEVVCGVGEGDSWWGVDVVFGGVYFGVVVVCSFLGGESPPPPPPPPPPRDHVP